MKNKKKHFIITIILLATAIFAMHFIPKNSETSAIETTQYKESKQEPSYNKEEPSNNEEIEQETTDDVSKHLVKFNSKYWFGDFNTKVYNGKLADPDFTDDPFADDQEYIEFITKGCEKNGINFGGYYTIIEKGCGAMCEHIFIINRKSGKIFTNITLKKDDDRDGKYGYEYKNDSRLLIANSNLLTPDYYYPTVWEIEPELYEWTGKNFKFINDWRVDETHNSGARGRKQK